MSEKKYTISGGRITAERDLEIRIPVPTRYEEVEKSENEQKVYDELSGSEKEELPVQYKEVTDENAFASLTSELDGLGRYYSYEIVKESVEEENENGVPVMTLRPKEIVLAVSKGASGGQIENKKNLPQYGNAWVGPDAVVKDNARVLQNAFVFGTAVISEEAVIYGASTVSGNAVIKGNALILDSSSISGSAEIKGQAIIDGSAAVSGASQIYGSGRVSGKAKVRGGQIYERAVVFGRAVVSENAALSGTSKTADNARISGNAQISGDAECYGSIRISGNAKITGTAKCWLNKEISEGTITKPDE